MEKRLSNMTFCALDLETTGVNPVFHRIVEVGIVKFNLFNTIDTFETFVDPEFPMPEEVIKIHGITDKMVSGAPKIIDLLDDISEFIDGSILVIQNPGFDLTFLERAFTDNKRTAPFLQAIDTVKLSRKSFPNLKNHKLGTLCSHFSIKLCNHRALSDAMGCMEIFLRILRKEDSSNIWILPDLESFHGNYIKSKIKKKNKRNNAIFNNFPIGKIIKIKYADNEGNITTRNILPNEHVEYGKKRYIIAHCYLRNENRHFKTNRILEIL